MAYTIKGRVKWIKYSEKGLIFALKAITQFEDDWLDTKEIYNIVFARKGTPKFEGFKEETEIIANDKEWLCMLQAARDEEVLFELGEI